MSTSALRSWLKRHGLVQSDLALICGVTERCVRRWVSGQSAAPQMLLLLMQAVDDGRIDIAWLAQVVSQQTERTAA
jgi:DNA-binding transcriptional regulator YiaG